MHLDERRLVGRFVRAKQQAFGLEEDHALGTYERVGVVPSARAAAEETGRRAAQEFAI